MSRYCEVTKKRPAPTTEGKKPSLLKRKLEVKELKESIRLRVSEAGLKAVKDAGGLVGFIKAQGETVKLTPKLEDLRKKLIAKKIIVIKKDEPEQAPEEAAPAQEKAAETEEKAAE